MDVNNWLRLMYLDRSSKERLVDSHPLLKKYFSKDSLKRKPKHLGSPLAKKLEDHKHKLTEQYFSLTDFKKIFEIIEFDELRKEKYMVEYENIMKRIKNPKDKNYALSQLYAQIEQDVQYFIGKEEKRDEIKNIPIEDQIQQNIILGSKDFKK